MAMHPNDNGIDWDRIPKHLYNEAAIAVTEFARECFTPQRDNIQKGFYDGHLHFETIGGSSLCVDRALSRLAASRSKWNTDPVSVALREALPNSRKAVEAEHLEVAA